MRDGTTEACHTVRGPLLVLAVLHCCAGHGHGHMRRAVCALGPLKKALKTQFALSPIFSSWFLQKLKYPVGILLQTSAEATGGNCTIYSTSVLVSATYLLF